MFKTAVVGCGAIATNKYLPILAKLKDRVQLVGICDVNQKALSSAAERFRVPNTHSSLSELISSQRPDLVIVCTPPQTHAELAVRALEGGAHVLVEKPMALSPLDCDKMNQAATLHAKKLGIMHSQFFHPPFEQVRQAICSGKYGRFLGMKVFLATPVGAMTSQRDHWAHRLPGGVIGETGPHAVYLSLAFLDNVRDVQVCFMKQLPEYPWSIAEDIRFDLIADNGLSSVTLVYGSKQTAAELDILCTEKLLRVDLQTRICVKYDRSGLSAYTVGKSVVSSAWQGVTGIAANSIHYALSKSLDGHYVGINRFLDYVSGRATYPATGEEGKQTTVVLEMVVRRLKEQTGS
jgi:predicted dehydrogenase